MVRAAVCQPLAARPPKNEPRAASLVEVKGLRIEGGGERLDLIGVDLDATGTEQSKTPN